MPGGPVGGTVPFIGTWLANEGHKEWLFTYVTITIAISLVVYVFFLPKRTQATALDAEFGSAFEDAARPVTTTRA